MGVKTANGGKKHRTNNGRRKKKASKKWIKSRPFFSNFHKQFLKGSTSMGWKGLQESYLHITSIVLSLPFECIIELCM